jgi:enoyl-CoA hydratase
MPADFPVPVSAGEAKAEDTVQVVRVDGGVGIVTMARARKVNALSLTMRRELVDAFAELADSAEIAAVVLTGIGRAFSAGVDLDDRDTPGQERRDLDDGPDPAFDVIGAIADSPFPTVAAVNGFAIAGGLEIALACDVIIGSRTAQFGDRHAHLGLVPSWGLTQRLARLVGVNRARQISFTGELFDATTMERWGLVNEVLADDQLMPRALEIARSMADADRLALGMVRRIYEVGGSGTFAEGLAFERATCRTHDQLHHAHRSAVQAQVGATTSISTTDDQAS